MLEIKQIILSGTQLSKKKTSILEKNEEAELKKDTIKISSKESVKQQIVKLNFKKG